MKISSISAAAMTLLAGKASASTPTRLRAMTEEVAANATSASDGITDAQLQDQFAGNPFFQALVMPDNATEPQFAEEDEEDGLSAQFDLLDVDSSMSMAGSIAASQNSGSIAASQNSNIGGGFGWGSKSGKGDDYCSIEQMRGSYVFQYDLWFSCDCGPYTVVRVRDAEKRADPQPRPLCQCDTTEYILRDRGVLLNFKRPSGPPPGRGRGMGMGAMVGRFSVCDPTLLFGPPGGMPGYPGGMPGYPGGMPGYPGGDPEYPGGMPLLPVIAVQTGVSQKDVVPFQIAVPNMYGADASIQGEYNCKTEEVYFGLVANLNMGTAAGFSTRKPAKKRRRLPVCENTQ